MAGTSSRKLVARLLGCALAAAGFVLLVAEFRYFYGNDLPEASGSPRANFGLLALLGLPCVVFAVGLVQLFCGVGLRRLPASFASYKLIWRIALAAATLAVTAAATLLAATLA